MKTDFVPWTVFVWAVGIISVAIVSLVGWVATANSGVGDLKTDIAVVKTNVTWIREQISTKQVTFKGQ
jgi:hypothetical protein